jgi:NADPH2:quinone reductase
MAEGTAQVWELIKADKLRMEIERVPLKDIESAWGRVDFQGRRLVVIP